MRVPLRSLLLTALRPASVCVAAGFPMFRVLSGVGPIMDKAEEDLTPEDVRLSPHCPMTVTLREASNEDCDSRLSWWWSRGWLC